MRDKTKKKEVHIKVAVAAAGVTSTLYLGFSGSLHVKPFLVGVTIHQVAPSPVPQFTIYNSPDSGLGMLIILCSKMNILCLRGTGLVL